MSISKRMNSRLDKIDALVEKGYILNSSFRGFYHKLRDEKNNTVNTFKRRSKGNSLPGFSWISFFFGPFVAVQIKHWSYFWFFGITCFICNLVDLPIIKITNIYFGFFSFVFSILFPVIYAINFPYQRWLFSKTNRKEIAIWKSVLIGFLLILLARTPSLIFTLRVYQIPQNPSIQQSSEPYCKYFKDLDVEICGIKNGSQYDVTVKKEDQKKNKIVGQYSIDCSKGKIRGKRSPGYNSVAPLWARESTKMFCKSANPESLTRTNIDKNSIPKDKTIIGTKEECLDIKDSNYLKVCIKNDKTNFFVRIFNKLNNENILQASGNCNGSDLAYNYGQKYLTLDKAEEAMERTMKSQISHCKSKLNFFPSQNNSELLNSSEDQIQGKTIKDKPNTEGIDNLSIPITKNDKEIGSIKLSNSESINFFQKIKDAGYYFISGVKKYNNKDYQGAISDYNKSISIFPTRDTYYNRGLAKHAEGDYQGAIFDFSSAIEKQPNDFASYTERGLAKNSLKDYKGAISDYTKAIEIKPDYSIAYHNRAITIGQGLGDEKSACDDFQKAISLGNIITSEWFKSENRSICVHMPTNLENNSSKSTSSANQGKDPILKDEINCPNFIQAQGKEKICL